MPTDRFIGFDRASDVEETERGVRAALGAEALRIDLVRDDVVRLAISRGGAFDEQPTPALCVDPLAGDVAFTVEREDGAVRVRTERLVVTLTLEPFGVDVHRPDGTPVAETAEPYRTLNDSWSLRRRRTPGDAFYGLGEKACGQDRGGRSFTLWNTDVLEPAAEERFGGDPEGVTFDPYYVSIPFVYQHAADGTMAASFVDNSHRAHYDFTATDAWTMRFDGGQYAEYVFAGPSMPEILEAYTWLTGRTPLPPRWALGYHQCRWQAYTQDDVLALAARHRELGIPLDALWLDIEHMDGYRVFTWNRELFPDPGAMMDALRDDGVRLVTIVDPGIKRDPGWPVFDEGVARDALCRTEGGDVFVGDVWPGDTAFPDFASGEGRAYWAELNAGHAASGVAGVWNDMNEPATGDIAPERMRFDHGRISHERGHNLYALWMARATVDGLLEARPGERPFVLSRAGSPGIQRYAANWMGDNQARWDHLWLSMPMAAGLGICGQAFVGADAGGFAGHSNGELLARWMQLAALTPFFRNHSMIGVRDQYAWSFGEEVLEVAREAVRLRYRLLPYIYGAFAQAAETGAPVQRPLVFDHQDDPVVRDLDDEFLLGGDLLVAPVIAPGATSRPVYLPAGEWIEWHTGERHDGRRHVVADAPLARIPLYVRAGAVVPLDVDGTLELHVFAPTADGEHTSLLVEDDGLSIDAPQRRTTLTLTRAGGALTLRGVAEGDADGRRPVVVHDGRRLEPEGDAFELAL